MRKIFTSSPSPFEELQRIIKGEVKSSQEKNVWFFPQSTENCVEAKIFQISHVEGFSYHHFIQPRYHHNHHRVLARQNLLFQLIAEFPRLENGEKDWKFSLFSRASPHWVYQKRALRKQHFRVKTTQIRVDWKGKKESSIELMFNELWVHETFNRERRLEERRWGWKLRSEERKKCLHYPHATHSFVHIFSHDCAHVENIKSRNKFPSSEWCSGW